MIKFQSHVLALVLGCAIALSATAQDPLPPTLPTMREVSPGIYEIGQLLLDQKALTVTFPGKLNLAEGILEYLLVTPRGSAHESLLVTEIQPNDLHFAMLLLGAKGSGLTVPAPGDAPPGQIDAKYLKTAPKLKGDNVLITVKWKAGDVEKTTPVEDWIMNTVTKRAMVRGPWIYTGSMFSEGHFLAQIDGAFAAVVTYPGALINNPRQSNDNDQAWIVNERSVPPANTPVEITIKLIPDASSTSPPPARP